MKNISTSQAPQRLLVRYSTAVTKCAIQVSISTYCKNEYKIKYFSFIKSLQLMPSVLSLIVKT